jgi:CspA family cold shock protein
MARGKIKTWISERGFGFIKPDGGGNDIFVYAREFEKAGLTEPEEGERVSYDVDTNTRSGKPAAVNLKAID